ncbi:sugar phosphate isomerase/epimerase family protein [Rhizobium metallidurans]|uniref:Sugar phosphate isomerase/epimerase n=1 Tax=Rhizobium metallidurans TaxID=1265931 RepID=A0A7W6GCZ1_9HYPH|nr:sugar phosphate isomerase/epimerase family protein [Rhizobium metallidurans]MBB3967343.1 sugar phosphate isomerase/epimerase [Rhizobium metallidurans]
MTGATRKWTRDNWPIAAAMIQYPNMLADGRSVQDQSAEDWSRTVGEVADAGFTEIDPTDSWLRVADLSPGRRAEFLDVVASHGMTIPAISSSRRSVIDADSGDEYLAYSHRVIDTAAEIGAASVSFGFFEPLTETQKKALWFWTEQGAKNPDDPAIWKKAVARISELGRHAAELGIEVSLEMYEDTYLGTADSSVRFVEEVGLDNVGINADLGNLIRLHRPVEHWLQMMTKVAPYAKYWHVKNYMRIEDEHAGLIATHPVPLESGLINYRTAIRLALEHGFASAFLCEHYGGDGLSVSATNRDYLRRILPRN